MDFIYDISFESDSETPLSSAVNNEYVRSFLLSGNCHCRIENLKTGNCFTYKIQKNKNTKNMFFVNVESGLGYIYCGYFYVNANLIDYRKGEKGKVDEKDIRIQALIYTLNKAEKLPSYVLVQHLGRCGCCGNSLLEPDSMRRGLCLECYNKKYED